jgi:GNAT superfamily N-acetyltransferase
VNGPAIRAAVPRDAAALAALRYEFRGGIGTVAEPEAAFIERCAGWMRRRLEDNSTWRCWVAALGDELVGTVWLQLLDKLPNPVAEPERHGYVSSLYVQPAFRGAGVGSALLSTCLEVCQRVGVDAVLLWPTPASRSLYLRHGFSVSDDLLERRLWTSPVHHAP